MDRETLLKLLHRYESLMPQDAVDNSQLARVLALGIAYLIDNSPPSLEDLRNAYIDALHQRDAAERQFQEKVSRINELDAEVERLCLAHELSKAEKTGVEIERNALRAEVERRADHHAHYHQFCSTGGNTPCSHERQNKRLRAALEKIEAGYGDRLYAAELASIARQAL